MWLSINLPGAEASQSVRLQLRGAGEGADSTPPHALQQPEGDRHVHVRFQAMPLTSAAV